MGVISAWRWWTGTPTGGESVWPCPRCDGKVRMTGFPSWQPGQPRPAYRPTVAHLVRVCGCERRGVPAVQEWPARRSRPHATYWWGGPVYHPADEDRAAT